MAEKSFKSIKRARMLTFDHINTHNRTIFSVCQIDRIDADNLIFNLPLACLIKWIACGV